MNDLQPCVPPARCRVLFHIRHVGVGGIENALLGWLKTLDRMQFSVDVSVALPTAELAAYRERLPADVNVHTLLDDAWLVSLHQQRREHRLTLGGRVVLGVGMSVWGQRRIRERLQALATQYDLLVDFDLTLRKMAGVMPLPVVGVRHFSLWSQRTGKARRVGRELARYDGVAVLNESMREQAQRLYGDTLRRVFVLPNAFDLAAMRAQADNGAPPDVRGPYVVCVARLDTRTKGLDTLLQAWARLRRTRPELAHRLVLVGDGPDRAALTAQRDALGLADAVDFAGLQRNPFRWIRGASALVLASRHEGAPNVLIEAMALDCMVVSTDCPVGPRDLLLGGKAGLLVPVDDEAALADALWTALDDAALRESCVRAAHAHVEGFGIVAGNQRFAAMARTVTAR